MNSIHRYFALLLETIFLGFSFVQLNDPDSFIWIVIYGSVSALSFFMFFGKFAKILSWTILIVYLIGAIYTWPSQYQGLIIGQGETRNIEKARETLGLLSCCAVMGYYIFLNKRRNVKQDE